MNFKRVLDKKVEITKIEKENQNKSRGITLIALVVIIIILLILAGISISMLTGENRNTKPCSRSKPKDEKRNSKRANTIRSNGSINY